MVEWFEATYEEINSSLNLPFNWSINLDPSKLSEKNYTLQIRGVGAGDSAEQFSLLSIVIVQGTGDNEDSSNGFNNILLIVLSLVLFAILLIFMMAQVKQPELLPSNKLEITGENLSGNEILEAEILDVVDDFEKSIGNNFLIKTLDTRDSIMKTMWGRRTGFMRCMI